MKDIRNLTQQYDFCTVSGHTVPKWLISSALFTNDMTLKISIYNQFGKEIQVITPERLSVIQFSWNTYKETKKAGIYEYIICLVEGETELAIIKGQITVKHHA
mgnify:FL=1